MTPKANGKNLATILDDLGVEGGSPSRPDQRPLATGLEPLDDALRGGLRPPDLVLVGGKPGVGKTITTLQWARNMVLDGAHAIFACYEHTARLLTARLLLAELGSVARAAKIADLEDVRSHVTDFAAGWKGLDEIPDGRGLLADALACLGAYADRLWLVPASSGSTGLAELTRLVEQCGNGRTVLFVDYLQKVALRPEPADESEKVTRIAGGLKDLALTHDCVVVAVAASSQAGLTAGRQRVHHLRGSSALAYEADVVVMLNEKLDAVSRVHSAFDPVKADGYRHRVVFSIEKNRTGPAGLDLEFEKDFAYARFVTPGGWVAERLVDGGITRE
ncbi:MAG: helicase DnaB [Actinobacteria bacterium]|nr:helicase DnaB [Actinomycetota bacterium]